jgi:3-ketoacyl-CoA synthase
MLLANALFRMGGAAILLTRNGNAVGDRPAAKYRVNHLVRVHMGSDTNAYTCVFQDVDKENKPGVRLDKNLMKVAAQTLTKNLTRLGPKILPLTVKLDFAFRFVHRWVQVYRNPALGKTLPPVVPRFQDAVQHIGIHAGGRAVIDAIQKALNLSDADVKPSRDVLFKYGNTSSSSIWYETVQIEETRKPKKGDLTLLLAFGSGFKVNTMVIEKLRD